MILDTAKERNPITPFFLTDRGNNKRGVITQCVKDALISCAKCIFKKSCLCNREG